MKPSPVQVLTYREAAERAKLSQRTIEREIDAGRLSYVEITARRRGILESDFENWLLSKRRVAPAQAVA